MGAPNDRGSTVARRIEAGATALFTLLVAWPFLSPSQYPLAYDGVTYSGPNLAFLFESLRRGRLPEWDDRLFGGVPFLANPSAAGLYPVKYLFAWLPADRAMVLISLTHLLLLAGGLYVLAGPVLRLRPPAAFVTVASVLGSGMTMVRSIQFEQIAVIAWVPWVLVGVELVIRAPARPIRAIVGTGAAAAMVLVAGHPQQVYLVAPLVGLWSLARAVDHGGGRRVVLGRLGRLAAVAVLGGALAAPQLLVTAMQYPAAQRPATISYELPSDPGYRLEGTTLGKSFLGDSTSEAPDSLGPVEGSTFVGMGVVVLAALGVAVIARRRRNDGWPITTAALVGAGALALLLSLGPQCTYVTGTFQGCSAGGSVYRALSSALPGFSLARVPARWSVDAVFVLAILAGFATDALARRRLAPRILAVGLGVLSAVVLAVVLGGGPDPEGAVTAAGRGTWVVVGALTVAAAIAAAVLGSPEARERKPTQRELRIQASGAVVAVAALVPALGIAVELGRPQLHSAARRLLTDDGFVQPASPLAELARDAGGRTLSATGTPVSDHRYLVTAERPNAGSLERVRTIDGYDGGLWVTSRWVRAMDPLTEVEFNRDLPLSSQLGGPPPPVLAARFGLKYLLVDPAGTARDLGADPADPEIILWARQLAGNGWTAPIATSGRFELLGNPEFLGEARIVHRTTTVASDDAWEQALRQAPLDEALVPAGSPVAARTCAEGDPSCAYQPVSLGRPRPGAIDAAVRVERGGLLVVPEQHASGWSATVDGTPVDIETVDAMSMGIPVDAGDHVVELRYRAPGLRPGLALAGAALGACAALLFLDRRTRRTP